MHLSAAQAKWAHSVLIAMLYGAGDYFLAHSGQPFGALFRGALVAGAVAVVGWAIRQVPQAS